MRVLIVTQLFWPEQFRVNDLAAELVRRGHEVTVLTGQPSVPARSHYPGYGGWRRRREQWRGVQVRRVPMLSRGREQGWRLALNYLSFAASASLLGPVLVPRHIDVIFVFQPSPVTVGIPAAVVKRLRRAPMVLWVQDLWPETLQATGAVTAPGVLAAVRRLVRGIYRRCDRVLVQSKGFLAPAMRTGATAGQLTYLPNWAEGDYCAADPAAHPPADAPERALLPPGFRVLFAGNLGTAQSLGTLLDAAELLRERRDISWVVLGDGRQRPWLEQQVAERGLAATVHLLGRRPLESMPTFFALADALVVTLARRPAYALTIPSKLQSYLAAGKPVVGALDGEGRRVIDDARAGYAAAAEDARGLADAVLRLQALPGDERARLGERGRRYFLEHFDRDRLLTDLEKILLETARV